MPAPRRVLLMSYWLEPGGTERQMTEIARRLDPGHFDARVGCIRARGLYLEDLRQARIEVREFPMSGFLRPSYWRAARDLRRYIREQRIDIVHAFDVPATLFAVPVARAAGAPVVISSQRAYRSLTPGKHPFLRLTDHMVQGIVVNSQTVRDTLIRQDRVPPELIHLCPNGLDLDVFFPAEKTGQGALHIGVAARLEPEKGLETLIDAFAELAEAGAGAHLTILGNGPLLAALQERARERGVSARCRLEPATRSVANWLRSFDIFVLPSLSEALSNALIEAMACGCCAIASRVGGNPELVEDGVSGLLFNAGDSKDLAKHLRRVLTDETARRSLAAAGCARMREKFPMAASVSRMEDIYNRVPAR